MSEALETRPFDFDGTRSRMRHVLGVKMDKELWERMGVKEGTKNSWITARRIPKRWIGDFCLDHGVREEWLRYGEGSQYPEATAS